MRILLVEDDLDYVNSYLAEVEKDYIVDVAYTASEGEFKSEVNDYDLIVIDSSLPDRESHLLCRDVRDADVRSPILLLSDKDDVSIRIKCLKNGANAVANKNVSAGELTAQITALLRLRHGRSNQNKITVGHLTLDLDSQQVAVNGKTLDLRKKEYEVLEQLVINRGQVVSKEDLLDHIWDEGILVHSNLLEVHIRNLRQKIEKPFGVKFIKTLRGFGYRVG